MKSYLFFFLTFSFLIFAQDSLGELPQRSKIHDTILHTDSPHIKTLYFIDNLKDVQSKIPIDSHGIIIKNFSIPDQSEFEKLMETFLGKPLVSEELILIKEAVADYYAKKNYPLIWVLVPPEQDISHGQIQMVILKSKWGKLKIIDNKYTPEERIKEAVSVKEGQYVNAASLLDDVTWLEYDPFRTIDVIYEQGERLGTTNVILRLKERFPFLVYSQYKNSPYQIAGPSRWKAGFNWGHLLGREHELDGEFSCANDPHRWWTLSMNYRIPFPWRDFFKFYGTYVSSRPTPEELLMPDGTISKCFYWQIGTRYEMRFKKWGNFSHMLTLGYDYKDSKNFLNYDINANVGQIVINQAVIRYEGAQSRPNQSLLFGVSLYKSFGKTFQSSENIISNSIFKRRHHTNYGYGIFNLDYVKKIWNDQFTWILNAILQATYEQLLSLDQFALGGHLTCRGYEESMAIADRGILLKNEIRTPAVSLNSRIKDELQFLAFMDFGYLNHVNRYILNKNNATFLSVGPGFRYRIGPYVDIRFDYGFELKSIYGKIFENDFHSRGHFEANLSF